MKFCNSKRNDNNLFAASLSRLTFTDQMMYFIIRNFIVLSLCNLSVLALGWFSGTLHSVLADKFDYNCV